MASTSEFDAMKLAERLRGWGKEEFWVHLQAAGMLEKYPAKQHARRVQENLGASKGLIYLPGQLLQNKEDSDMPVPFRQRRYFYYLTGCNEFNCHVTYDIQHDHLVLFIPRINPERVIWNGRGSTQAEALDKYDIDDVYFNDQLPSWIQTWSARNQGRLYILHDFQVPPIQFFKGAVDSSSLQPAVDLARVIKDDHEIGLIRKANDISSEAHRQVLANIHKFTNEAQVEGLFVDVCIANQAKEQAYAPIAASGPNAGTLHYDSNNEDFGDRQLICLDAGCEYELYASDITRSFPLSGSWPSVEAKNIYKLVERMQETCIKRLAPGVRYLDLHILAHHIAIDGLLRLGILHNGTIEEIYKAGTSRAFFPHGLGHHVGLEVHDVGYKELTSLCGINQSSEKVPSLYPENFHLPVYDEKLCLSPTDPQSTHLQEGMVVTVEPGIYFSAYALNYFYLPSPIHSKYINKEVLSRYFPVGGVRIEDDILITSRGHENLTTAPKGEAMLEIIRTKNPNLQSLPEVFGVEKSRLSSRKQDQVLEEPLLPAPGISKSTSEESIKSLKRAATAPVECRRNHSTADFEKFDGPSLFSGFKRSATVGGPSERAPGRKTDRQFSTEQPTALPMCGVPSSEVSHLYMTWEGSSDSRPILPQSSRETPKLQCRNCIVLMQSVDRLRQLQAPNARRHRPEQNPYPQGKPTASRSGPEMTQRHSTSNDYFKFPYGVPFETAKLKKETIGDIPSSNALRTDTLGKAETDFPVAPLRQRHSALPLNYGTKPGEMTAKFHSVTVQPKQYPPESPQRKIPSECKPRSLNDARPLQERASRAPITTPPRPDQAAQNASFPPASSAGPTIPGHVKPRDNRVVQHGSLATEQMPHDTSSPKARRTPEGGATSTATSTTVQHQSRNPTIDQEMVNLRNTMDQLVKKFERLQADYNAS